MGVSNGGARGAGRNPSCFNRMLQLGKPHFLLDIRSAIGAGEPIPASVTLRASSGGYTPMLDGKILYDRDYSLTDRYDALVFINQVTLPKLLK
jgi:hypothetical protein